MKRRTAILLCLVMLFHLVPSYWLSWVAAEEKGSLELSFSELEYHHGTEFAPIVLYTAPAGKDVMLSINFNGFTGLGIEQVIPNGSSFEQKVNGGNSLSLTFPFYKVLSDFSASTPYLVITFTMTVKPIDDGISYQLSVTNTFEVQHDYKDWISSTEETHSYQCECGGVASTAHEITEIDAIEATCTENGYEAGSYCAICDLTISGRELIEKSNHLFDAGDYQPPIAPTCTVAGKTEGGFCTICSLVIEQEDLPALGHTWGDWVAKQGTEGMVYYHERACSTCLQAEQINCVFETLSITPPACELGGYSTYKCTTCANVYQGDATPATGHRLEPALFHAEDTHIINCAACDYSLVETHHYLLSATLADSHTHTCVTCQHAVSQPHSYVWHEDAEGLQIGTCMVCAAVSTKDPSVSLPVTGISLPADSPSTLDIGDSYRLVPIFKPVNATNRAVIWTSDNPAVVTVNADGLYTAIAPGTARITVTSEEGNFTASHEVTVRPPEIEVPVPVTGISLPADSPSILDIGDSYRIVPVFKPANASNRAVTWTSNNPVAVTVNVDGLYTAISSGSARITVTSVDGNFTASHDVTVRQQEIDEPVPVSGISLPTGSPMTLNVGKTHPLTATITPSNASDTTVTWSSNAPTVATVNAQGLVTAIGPGTAIITVKTNDGGKTASFTYNVWQPVSSISLPSGSPMTLNVGKTHPLTATITPNNASDQTVTWFSNAPTIATVDANGLVTAVGLGKATVTVKTNDGGKIASFTFNVWQPVSGISLPADSPSILDIGDSYRLVPIFKPANATNRAVTWTSNNPAAVTVNADGLYTAIAPGTARITVTSVDGGYTSTHEVTVRQQEIDAPVPVTGISLPTGSPKTLNVNDTHPLTATITPSSASDKTLTWSSNAPTVATVNAQGLVTAVGPGTATITVKTNDGGKTASFTLNVRQQVASISLPADSPSILVIGDSYRLVPVLTPANASNKAVTWSSNNPAVVMVNADGLYTAIAPGTARIMVTSADGNFTASHDVTVRQPEIGIPIMVSSLTFPANTPTTLNAGQSYQLTITAMPTNASNAAVQWSSSDLSIATVSANGLVTAYKAGTLTITATSTDGSRKTASLRLNVQQPTIDTPILVNSLIFPANTPTSLIVGQTHQLTATATPVDASNTTVHWSSSDPTVATINEDGQVTALKSGNVIITATALDGSNLSAQHAFTVILPGDANNNGKVTVDDLLPIIDHILFGVDIPSVPNADVSQGEGITMKDLERLIDLLVGKWPT